jgi:2-C-methyl-D-erythritol 4-phosphate cytidylyltransferase
LDVGRWTFLILPMLAAILVAAGQSRRMGFDKLFALLDGQPVVAHAIRIFEQTDCVSDIILVGRKGRLRELREVVVKNRFRKVSRIIAGGARRQDSVRLGLKQLGAKANYVAVHDAARPLVRIETIEQVFALARSCGAATCAAPVSDTLKRVDRDCVVIGGVERDRLYAVQTPQIFRRDLLVKAYAKVSKTKLVITDEISAVEYLGEKIVLLPNNDPNFKITYPADLPLAEFVLQQRGRIS